MSLRQAAAVLFAAALCACASSPPSQFLGDVSALRAVPDAPGARIWLAPDADLLEYDRLMIDRVTVMLAPDAAARSLDPALVEELAEELRATLVRTVDPYYPVLDAPATRTMRLRIALTDVETAASPAGTADVLASSVEWEVVDSKTRRRLGAGIRRREADPQGSGFQSWADALLSFMNARKTAR